MKRFASPRVFVLVTVQRNDEARCLADLIKNEFGDGAGLFFVTDIAEIMSAPDALAAKWHHASQGFHTLI